MDSLKEILKEFRRLTDEMNTDGIKFHEKDNRKAGMRCRKNANLIRLMMPKLRKEITEELERRINGTNV